MEELAHVATEQAQGITRLLPISIPHFRDAVVSSFECLHCGNTNTDFMSLNVIKDFGTQWKLHCTNEKDLSRHIVRSEYASIKIVEIDFEAPSTESFRGALTTVEGLLAHFIDDLSFHQEERKNLSDPSLFTTIENIISELELMRTSQRPFTLILDDPSGNSYIEYLPSSSTQSNSFQLDAVEFLDSFLSIVHYKRTPEQNKILCFKDPSEDCGENSESKEKNKNEKDDREESIYEFPGICPSCSGECPTRMHPINIPYFKEVIIMATTCPRCSYRSSEVKTGGPISPFGKRITFQLETMEDLSRDILKSDTCSISIPDIGLELGTGTLGGKFTTVEGLLSQIKEEIAEKVPFSMGDSATQEQSQLVQRIINFLTEVITTGKNLTLVIDDPLSNSYLQNLCAPDPDPQIKIAEYKRTREQDEALGLLDMSV